MLGGWGGQHIYTDKAVSDADSSYANESFTEPWRPSLKSVKKGYQEKVYQLPRQPLQGIN